MSDYRIKFTIDEDARPLTETEYADYLAYYGNPDRHVYLGAVVEECCDRCGQWAVVASLWNIDLMDDDPAYLQTPLDTWIPLDAPLTGYLAQIRDELRDEAIGATA